MVRILNILLVIVLILLTANFLQEVSPNLAYQLQVPNGNRVPHPCDRSQVWAGVGHQTSEGGTLLLNQFGQDFLSSGRFWTNTLCRQDSDGDGKTNGEELGDPNCQWVMGATPWVTNVTLLSHPGVCEPITSDACKAKNTFLPAIAVCALTLNTTTAASVTTTTTTVAGQVITTTTKKSTASSLFTMMDFNNKAIIIILLRLLLIESLRL